MRHGKKFNHLSRKAPHRSAMLANMAAQLIMYKRIKTTVAKAKALRKYVEPLITKSKNDTTHTRRVVYSYLGHKDPVKELFITVADRVGERPGGYTRIIKLGKRLGDNAEMAYIELVDFNELLLKEKTEGKKKKRTRRSGSKTSSTTPEKAAAEDSKTNETSAETKEEPKAKVQETGEAKVKDEQKAEETKKAEADKKKDEPKAEKEDKEGTDNEDGDKEK